jgi:hypothetical protein
MGRVNPTCLVPYGTGNLALSTQRFINDERNHETIHLPRLKWLA